MLKKIQGCSLEFLGSLGGQVDILREALDVNLSVTANETLPGVDCDIGDVSLVDRSSFEDSMLADPRVTNFDAENSQNQQGMKDLNMSNEEENGEMISKIMEEKKFMENELKEADKILDFLDQFTMDLDLGENYNNMKNIDPKSIVLQSANVNDFLKQTNEFFSKQRFEIFDGMDSKVQVLEQENARMALNLSSVTESIKDPNSQGLKSSLKRMIMLQKECKKKDEEIIILNKRHAKMLRLIEGCHCGLAEEIESMEQGQRFLDKSSNSYSDQSGISARISTTAIKAKMADMVIENDNLKSEMRKMGSSLQMMKEEAVLRERQLEEIPKDLIGKCLYQLIFLLLIELD